MIIVSSKHELMKNSKRNRAIAILAFVIAGLSAYSQAPGQWNPKYSLSFDTDSLKGFDETAAKSALFSEQYVGDEIYVKMYSLKRAYINDKYKLWGKQLQNNTYGTQAIALAACNNEDFEASPSGTIATQNQISGWTISRGNVTPPNNACNLIGCCPQNPSESYLISAPNGYVDPIIGSCYPIYSVFGSVPGDPNGTINNPQLTQLMYGDNFIRLNSSALGADAFSIERLNKTFVVSANNALFQFAYIFVTATGHACCSAGSLQFKLTNVTTNTPLACPGYTTVGPTASCPGNTIANVPYFIQQTCAAATLNSQVIFNKWKTAAMDLSPFIGQTISIDIIVADCDAGGHYGYAYIDAQCSPVSISVNNQPVYSNTVIAQSCSSIAAISAPGGFSNYTWVGPAGFTGSTSAVTTTVPGTYVVSMGNGPLCQPTSMTVQVGFSPNNLSASSTHSFLCAGQSATLSASAMTTYTWSNGLNTPSIVVTPAQSGTFAVAGTDASLCVHFATLSINVSNPTLNISGSDSTICDGEAVQLTGSGVSTYTWSTGANGPSIVVSPSVSMVYTATGTDASGCQASSPGFTLWVSPCVGTSEIEKDKLRVKVFPNPNKGEFNLQINDPIQQGLFKLFSADGQLVFVQNVNQGNNNIKIEKLSAGIYFYSISNNKEQLKKGKLQIE